MSSRGILCQLQQSFLNMLLDLRLDKSLKNQKGKKKRWGFYVFLGGLYDVRKSLFCGLITTSVSSQQRAADSTTFFTFTICVAPSMISQELLEIKDPSTNLIASFIVYTISNQIKAFLQLLSKSNYIFARKVFEMLHVFRGAQRPRGR